MQHSAKNPFDGPPREQLFHEEDHFGIAAADITELGIAGVAYFHDCNGNMHGIWRISLRLLVKLIEALGHFAVRGIGLGAIYMLG